MLRNKRFCYQDSQGTINGLRGIWRSPFVFNPGCARGRELDTGVGWEARAIPFARARPASSHAST